MKKLILNIFLLALIVFVCDRGLAWLLDKQFYKQTHGDDHTTIELLEHCKAEVVILGSSRASHHYISDSIEKYTGYSCFNGGRDNMGIHYVAAIMPELLKRHEPKHIILDIIPNNFVKDDQCNETYFDIQSSALLPFVKQHPSLLISIQDFAPIQAAKSKALACYAYNSLVGTIIQNAYTKLGHVSIKGYEPIYDSIKPSLHKTQSQPMLGKTNIVDTASIRLLEQVLDLCNKNNISVTVIGSPFYFSMPVRQAAASALLEVCNRQNVKYYDFSSSTAYCSQYAMFYDEVHLNHTGAIAFTKEICQLIFTP
ncbi:MAG: hypothetical protein RL660_152 [Bacteroidota bacterium]|jgi:hypothetical protein